MKYDKNELDAVEGALETSDLIELQELQLAMVGGGTGEVVMV